MTPRIEKVYSVQSKSIDSLGICTKAEVVYLVFDVNDETEALSTLFEKVEKVANNLPFLSAEVSERRAETVFVVTVNYERDTGNDTTSNDDDEEPVMSFECSTGSKHITQAISQKCVYGKREAGGAIGWNGKTGADSEVAGVDVPTAQLRETYTRVMSASRITNTFKRTVARLTGKVNSQGFKGWEVGEVMFMGMGYSAPTKGNPKITVTFNFAIQINESDEKVGGHSISKKGFDYVWAIIKSIVGKNGVPASEVEAIFVDQVCKTADFGVLGLGR